MRPKPFHHYLEKDTGQVVRISAVQRPRPRNTAAGWTPMEWDCRVEKWVQGPYELYWKTLQHLVFLGTVIPGPNDET